MHALTRSEYKADRLDEAAYHAAMRAEIARSVREQKIGPGVSDIHSPNIPVQERMVDLMQKSAERIPVERLWINPDCGLKTRQWDEVIPALSNIVVAAKQLRASA